MKTPLFQGVCTALVTPFANGRINYPMVEALLHRQIDAGVRAIVICGTTGEAPTLTDAEKLELIRFSKQVVGDQCLIIAGTGSNSTAHTVELSLAARDNGADGLLLVSPYYNKANPEGLYRHYATVADGTGLPCILYNVPSRTGLDIPISVYQRLCNHENIAGVKEASSDIIKITKIRLLCPDGFPIWTGNDDQITPVTAMGGCGVISVLSNILPQETRLLTESALNGKFDQASDLQIRLQPLIDALFSEVNPIPVKQAMKLIGFDCGPCRLPLGPMETGKMQQLEKVLLQLR